MYLQKESSYHVYSTFDTIQWFPYHVIYSRNIFQILWIREVLFDK